MNSSDLCLFAKPAAALDPAPAVATAEAEAEVAQIASHVQGGVQTRHPVPRAGVPILPLPRLRNALQVQAQRHRQSHRRRLGQHLPL